METFPLLTLPYVPLKEVVKTMDFLEQNKLSLVTPRTEAMIKFMNTKIDYVSIRISQEECLLNLTNLKSHKSSPIPAFYKRQEDVDPPTNNKHVVPKEPHIVDDPIEECIKMAKRFYEVFTVKHKLDFSVIYDHEDPGGMKNLTSRLLSEENCGLGMKDFEFGEVGWARKLDRTVLTHLMDTLKLDAYISIYGLIPDDFRHEKAFKFRYMDYPHAKWITMEDIKSIRNADKFSCYYTNFNSKDINEFLHYWISCDEDMMEECEIGIEGNVDIEGIFDGISAVKVQGEHHWNGKIYEVNEPAKLIKVRNPSNRKFTIAQVMLIRSNEIELKVFEPSEKYKLQMEILDEMERIEKLKEKEDLEKQLEDIQKRLAALNEELMS